MKLIGQAALYSLELCHQAYLLRSRDRQIKRLHLRNFQSHFHIQNDEQFYLNDSFGLSDEREGGEQVYKTIAI